MNVLQSDNTMSSSPAPAIFSDDAVPSSSPPSSPPGFPWEKQSARKDTNTTATIVKSAFSVLGKRKVLETVSDNARPSKKHVSSRQDAKALTQMQISIGQVVRKKCKDCGMEYVPSSTEDRKLHDRHHKQSVEGYDVGVHFIEQTALPKMFRGIKSEDRVIMVDCWDSQHRKKRAQAVLNMVQRELGAVDLPQHEIWNAKRQEKQTRGMNSRFRSYLYVRGTKVIGYVLVQNIREAHQVLEPQSLSEDRIPTDKLRDNTASRALKARLEAKARRLSQPLQLSSTTLPAELGISRIWSSPSHRKANIATELLDTVLMHFNGLVRDCDNFNALESSKEEESRKSICPPPRKDVVAFSQPTEAGTRLARRWFGKDYGWSVYVD